jgi:hypothetical protein
MMAIQGQMVAAAISIAPQMQADTDKAARNSAVNHPTKTYRSDPDERETSEPAYGEPMDTAAGSD